MHLAARRAYAVRCASERQQYFRVHQCRPALLNVLEERAKLARNYEALRQELRKDKIVIWD